MSGAVDFDSESELTPAPSPSSSPAKSFVPAPTPGRRDSYASSSDDNRRRAKPRSSVRSPKSVSASKKRGLNARDYTPSDDGDAAPDVTPRRANASAKAPPPKRARKDSATSNKANVRDRPPSSDSPPGSGSKAPPRIRLKVNGGTPSRTKEKSAKGNPTTTSSTNGLVVKMPTRPSAVAAAVSPTDAKKVGDGSGDHSSSELSHGPSSSDEKKGTNDMGGGEDDEDEDDDDDEEVVKLRGKRRRPSGRIASSGDEESASSGKRPKGSTRATTKGHKAELSSTTRRGAGARKRNGGKNDSEGDDYDDMATSSEEGELSENDFSSLDSDGEFKPEDEDMPAKVGKSRREAAARTTSKRKRGAGAEVEGRPERGKVGGGAPKKKKKKPTAMDEDDKAQSAARRKAKDAPALHARSAKELKQRVRADQEKERAKQEARLAKAKAEGEKTSPNKSALGAGPPKPAMTDSTSAATSVPVPPRSKLPSISRRRPSLENSPPKAAGRPGPTPSSTTSTDLSNPVNWRALFLGGPSKEEKEERERKKKEEEARRDRERKREEEERRRREREEKAREGLGLAEGAAGWGSGSGVSGRAPHGKPLGLPMPVGDRRSTPGRSPYYPPRAQQECKPMKMTKEETQRLRAQERQRNLEALDKSFDMAAQAETMKNFESFMKSHSYCPDPRKIGLAFKPMPWN